MGILKLFKSYIVLLMLLGLSSSCGQKQKSVVMAKDASATDRQFAALLTDYTRAVERMDAFYAPYYNIEENLKEFGDYLSPEWKSRYETLIYQTLSKVQEIKPESLSPILRLNYELLKDQLETEVSGLKYPNELMINQKYNRLSQFLDDSSPTLSNFPFDSVQHYDDFISRSKGFPVYVERQITRLREGLQKKVVVNCSIANKMRSSYQAALEPVANKNPFFRPVEKFPSAIPSREYERLRKDYTDAITQYIQPGYQKFDTFFHKEYAPKCRRSFGYGDLPNGENWYQHQIRESTSLNLSPEKVHQTGLKEVARINQEIDQIRKQRKFKGNQQAFLKAVTTDPKIYFASGTEAIKTFEAARDTVESRVVDYFNLRPKSLYKILESENPNAAAGSYNDPTDSKPYGRFMLNTKNLRSNNKLEVTTLFMHEAVPGHHFQIALQFENRDRLTDFQRKIFSSNAFVEGWALYAEYLGREMGLFEDADQRLGHLSSEMLRAVRLVVDTGIHYKKWDYKKSVQYMAANLISDPADIESEVLRYAAWPGQALGYKIGQLKIIELRKDAESKLGSRFSLKGFHDEVLRDGTVTLPVLERKINNWVALQN